MQNQKKKIDIVDMIIVLYILSEHVIQHPFVQTVLSDVTAKPNCVVRNIDLWHYQIGHPSIEKLNEIKSVILTCLLIKIIYVIPIIKPNKKKTPFLIE